MPKDGKETKQRRQEAWELAACFVLHATEQTQAPNSWIARDGDHGLFAIFAQMVPQVQFIQTYVFSYTCYIKTGLKSDF